jgi:hypothetical protein
LELAVWPARTNSFEQSPWCQRKWWACSWLCTSPVSPTSVCLNRACHSDARVRLMLSTPNACLIFARVSFPLFPIFAQNLMLFFGVIHCKIASGQLQDMKLKDVKKSAHSPSCVKFCVLTPKIY